MPANESACARGIGAVLLLLWPWGCGGAAAGEESGFGGRAVGGGSDVGGGNDVGGGWVNAGSPNGGGSGRGGGSGASGGGSGSEFCSTTARCDSGRITGMYGAGCYQYSLTCMLGCRKDDGFAGLGSHGQSTEEALDFGRQLCEEYRLAHGPRRPGDPCATDFDCLPYAGEVPRVGAAWSRALSCGDVGVCEEAVVTRDDPGLRCDPSDTPGSWRSPYLAPGACESGICLATMSSFPRVDVCTMPCNESTDCPAPMECASVAIGNESKSIDIGMAKVCIFPIDAGGGGSGGSGGGGSGGDGGSSDGGTESGGSGGAISDGGSPAAGAGGSIDGGGSSGASADGGSSTGGDGSGAGAANGGASGGSG